MSYGIGADAAMKVLRKEEVLEVHAVARSQNGTVIEDVMFAWEVGTDADTVDDDPSDDTMSNMISAEVTGKTTVTVTAKDHHVAAELKIEVTAKVGGVTLMAMGAEDAFEAADSYFPGDVVAAKLQAIPDVGYRAGSDVKWSVAGGAAKVEPMKEDNPNKRYAKITAKSAGTATVTAMYEGKEASFDVVVSGSRDDRQLTYVVGDNVTFTWLLARTGANARPASSAWDPGSIAFEAVLEDADGDPLVNKPVIADLDVAEAATTPTLTGEDTSSRGGTASAKDGTTFVVTGYTGNDGTVVFTITAPSGTPTAAAMTNYTVTLMSRGARTQQIRFHVDVQE